jgi:CHASE2 domain-containing sensor protein
MDNHKRKRFNSAFHRDVFLATVFTFAGLFLLKLIFFNTHYLDPISRAIEDFQFTDLYYSKLQQHSASDVNTDIVLVNIGANSRAEIAEQLNTLYSFQPKAVGLDVTFAERKNPREDSLLKKSLAGFDRLVVTENIEYGKAEHADIISSHPYFEVESKSAFGNFLAQENKVIRYFSPYFKKGLPEEQKSFTASLAEIVDPAAFSRLNERQNQAEVIHYRRQHFIQFDHDEIRPDNPALTVLKDKIVLIGYMGDRLGQLTLEDLHLTPLNSSFGGHSVPDMYGVEIHAQILSMILNGDYINHLPQWSVLLISFLITLLHMYLFLYFYVKKHVWFHLVAKVAQLLSFGVIVIASLFAYHFLHWKAEPAYLLVAVALSVDMLYFYDGLVRWMHQKFGYDTYFNQGHH